MDGAVVRRAAATSARPSSPAATTRVVRVQRRRGARAGARARRRRLRAGRAGADERRHRPCRDPASTRRCATLTRETGTLLAIDETHTICCGPGGYTARARARARHRSRSASRSPAACRRPPTGSRPSVAERVRRDDRARGRRRGRHRRHARRERPLARRDAGDARRGADRGGVRAHDPARRAAGRPGVRGRHRRHRPALARDPARLPRRVPLQPGPARATGARRMPPATSRSSATCTCTRSTAASC